MKSRTHDSGSAFVAAMSAMTSMASARKTICSAPMTRANCSIFPLRSASGEGKHGALLGVELSKQGMG